jgi:hypothetical protein
LTIEASDFQGRVLGVSFIASNTREDARQAARELLADLGHEAADTRRIAANLDGREAFAWSPGELARESVGRSAGAKPRSSWA